MKKALFFLMTLTLLSLSWGGAVKAQTTGCAAIGEESTSYGAGGYSGAGYMPIDIYYKYSYEQMVYDGSEMPTAITSICFKYKSSYALTQKSNVDIYLGETTSATLSSWMPADELTLVYSGALDFPASSTGDWVEFTFNQNGGSFSHDQSKYIVVVVNDKSYDYPSSYSNMFFCYQTCEAGVHKYLRNDGNEYSVPPTSSATNASQCPIVRFCGTFPAISCEKPSTLEVPSVTTAGATLTWTGGSGTYNLEVKGGSYADWTSVLSNTTLTTTTLTPLDPETQYQVRVQSVCGEEVSGWKTTSFTTPCGILSTFPKTYTFETSDGFPSNASTPTTNQLGNCWRNEATVQSGSYSTRVWGTSTSNKKNGSQSLVLPDKGSGSKTMLVFPAMDFTSANGYVVSFWIYRNSTGSNPEGFKVYASDCDTIGANAVELGHYSRYYNIAYPQTESTSGWYYYETAPITMTGTVYIIFEGQSYFQSATYVDDVTIKVAPSCLKPSALEVFSTSINSANLFWSPNSSEDAWTLYYKKTTDENYTEVPNVTDIPYLLPGLDHSTNYQFYVVANCSATDNSEASDVKTFSTECAAISADGYSANFDDYSIASAYTPSSRTLPLCWKSFNECTYSSYMNYPTIYYYSSTDYSNSSPNSLRFYSYYSSTYDYDPQPQYAILPEMTDLTSKQITLQARGYNASSSFKVGTMSDPTDASTFTEITSSSDNPAAMTTSYQEYIFYIPSNTTDRYVAIMIEAANSTRTANGAYIDDIVFSVAPTCWRTQNLAASNVTNESAILTWQRHVMGEETAWVLQYGTDENFGDGTYTEVTPSTNPTYTIENGLAATTTYYVRVKPACDNDGNLWSDTISFETEASCMIPNNLVISDVAAHEASLTWNGNNEHFIVERGSFDNTATPVAVTVLDEGFEGGTMPEGWSTVGTNSWAIGAGSGHGSVVTSAATDSYNAYFYSGNSTGNGRLITPAINLSGAASATLSFKYTNPVWSGGRYSLSIFYRVNGGEWNQIGTTITEYHDEWTNSDVYVLPALASNYEICFYTTGSDGDYGHGMGIDDVVIEAEEYPIVWTVVDNNVAQSANAGTYPFENLNPETTYFARVTGVCGTDESDPSNPISFTTTIACPTPTNLAYDNVAAHTADLTWNVNGNPTTNYVLTKEYDETSEMENIVVTINEGVASYALTELNGETEYTVSVHANCGTEDGSSMESNEVTFTTQVSCAIPTGLAAIDETTSSIKLQWTANNGETAWVVAHKIDGADEFTEVTVAQADLDGDGNYNLTGLSDGKTYTLKVRANCGETDGLSQWSSTITHATAASCATPTNLTVSDVNGHGATISWTDAPVVGKNYIVMVASEDMALNVDFENNSIPSNFTNDADYPWYVVANTYSGAYCVRSGGYNINYAESELTVDVTLANDATLTFSAKISSEEDWDKGYFYIDETVQTDLNGISGDGNWINYSYNLSAGAHTLKWKYEKDNYGSSNDDCIYVDNIKITAGASAFVEKDPTPATSLVLDDLDPETTYYVKVKGDCGSATSPESGVETFTTPAACNAPTSLTYDDESVTGHTVDFSWTENNGATAWKVIYSKVNIDNSEITVDIDENDVTTDGTTITYTLTGLDGQTDYIARVKSNCGGVHNDISAESNSTSFTTLTACYPVGDVITSDITAYTVTVHWSDYYNAGAYIVKQGDNVLDGTTTPSVVINADNHTAIISGLEPEHTYTYGTFKVFADCGTEGMSTGTNVPNFQTEPSCHPVTNVNITGKTPNSVTFTWEDTHTPDTYIIKEGENVLTGETAHSVVIDATNHTATISGLSENQIYSAGTFKVFADCGTTDGQSAGVNVPAFTTPCSAHNTFPWTENFNDLTTANTIPDCWNNDEGTTSTASYKWCYTTTTGNGGCNGTSHDGSNCVRFYSYTGSHINYLKSIPLSLPTDQTMQLKFWYKNPNGGDFSVYISTDGGATHETALATGLTGVSDWTEHDPINLSAYAGQEVVLVFKGTSNNGNGNPYIYLDDVTVEEAPACAPPTALGATAISNYSATLGWTANSGETEWTLYYKKTSDENYTEVTENVTNPYAIAVDPATEYIYYVVANCSATTTSDPSATYTFTTKCNPFVVHRNQSFTENFDATTFPPTSCWNTIPSGTYDWSRDGTSGKNHSGSIYGSAYSYYYGDVYLVLPDIALTDDATDVKLTFWSYNTYVGSYGKNSVVLLDGDNETELWSPTSVSESWKCDTVNLSAYKGQTISLAFKYEGSNAHGWYLDDIAVAFDPCYPVTNLSYDNESLTANTVALSWTPGAETNWRLQYRENGTQDWNTVDVAETDLINGVYTLDQLNAGATYEWQVAAACTNTFISDYTAGANFTTLENCPAPTNLTLTTDSETPNGATITWTAGSTANEHFTVEYRVVNEETWIEIPSYIEETTYTFTTLEPATTYQVRVSAVCGTYLSDYSDVVEFTTEANPGFTVTFIAGNSGTCNTSELTGVTVELPAATPLQDCAANGWTFAGWTTTELTENTTTAPAPLYEAGTSYTPSASILMYAVYMRTEGEATSSSYNLVTEAPNDWSGEYLIVYTGANTAFNSSLQTLDASSNVIDISNFLNNSSIASNATTDAAKVTIAAMTGGYSILAANGKYIGSKNNNDNQLASETTPILNTISLVEGNADIVSSLEHLRCNVNNNVKRFRYYKSTSYTGQNAIQLYRYTSATPVTYAGAPDCSVPVSYNIIVTQVQGATIMAPSTAAAGNEVQLIIVPEDGYALNEWQVTTSTGPVTVTNNSFVMPAANVNVTATLFNVYTVAATADPASGGTVNGAGSYSNSYNEGEEITLTAAANTGYDFKGWYNGDDQVSENTSYTFTVTGNVTLEARFAERHTVTFIPGTNGTCNPGSLEGSTVDLSNVVALPSAICVSQGWEFAGWSETSVDETTSAPTLVNTIYSPASDIDLYAVYKKTDAGAGQDTWTMATSIAVGDVVVMAYEGTVKKELTGVSGNIGTATDYTTLPAGTYPLTVEQGYADNSYAFKNNSNYLAYTGSGNNLYTQTEKDNKSSWTINNVTDGFDIINVNYNTRKLQYNTGSPRFACYTGSQKPVQFYKLVPGDITTYNSNPACISSYNISATSADETQGTVSGTVGAEVFANGTYNEGTEITLTATANEGYTFVNWTKGGETVSYESTYTFTVTEDASFVANFSVNSYNITANVAPANSGSVEGAGSYTYGSTATLTATAATGYHFVNWTKDDVQVSTDAEYSFTVTGDATYVANFELNNYDITVSANPTEGGTVSGDGNFNYGDNVILTATANTGYTFVNWTKGGESVSTNPTCTLAVAGAAAYVANFELNSYDITVSANPTAGGTVSGGDTYNHGATVTLTATANEGYTFTNWTKSGEEVSTESTYSFAAEAAGDYVANFTLNSYEITATVNPAEGGSVTGAGTYSHGANVTLTAIANNGYHFVNWTENDAEVSTDASYSFTFTGARNLVANFAITPAGLSWSAQDFTGYTMIDFNNWKPTVNNPNNVSLRYGCVEGNLAQGGIEVDATTGVLGMAAAYGHIHPISGTFHIYAVHETDETAYYDSIAYTLNVLPIALVGLTKNIDEGGSVSMPDATDVPTLTHYYTSLDGMPAAYVAQGQNVNILAESATGYHFTEWTLTNVNHDHIETVATTEAYTYHVPDVITDNVLVRNIMAVFDTNTYALNVVSANETMGIVEGSTTAKHFLSYQISATPNIGYHFTQWSDGNTQNPRTVTLTENTTYTAEFAVNTYAITTGVLPANSGSVTGAGTYNHFDNATLTATATTGYTFTNWTENGVVVNATNPYEFQVTGERELVANFNLNTYAVSASANPANGGSVEGAGTYDHGTNVTLTATANDGYAFVNWTEGGQEVSTDASYTFTFTEGRTLVANFTPITYTVTFNPGTGTCQTESLTGSIESSINIDAVTATPEAICGNQDWVFAGWSTASVGETSQAPAFVSGTEYIPTDNITLYAVYTKTEQGEGTWANATSIEVGDRLALVCSTANRELSGVSTGTSPIYGTIASYAGSPAGVYPLTVVQGNNGSTYAFKTSDNTYLSWSSQNSLTTRSNIINESSWNVTFASGNATISNAKDNSRKLQYNSSSPRFACYSSTQTAVQLYKYTASSMTVYNSNPVCYVYAVNVDQNIEHGSVVADQTTDIVAGTEITLTPTPETGYHFGSWIVTAGNDPVTVENNKFSMPESNVNVSALFWIDTLTVNVNANPAVGGTVSGAGDYEYGDMVTLNATANTGYTFVNWTENNQEVSADATYEFTFNGEAGTRTFVANFSLNSYEITVSANPTAGGNVNGGNTYNHGATAMLTANPSTGYHFVNWTKEGVVVSTDANYSFTVAEAGAYVANFELNSYTIAATANPTAGGTVTGTGTYNHFDNVTLTATVSNGYDFIGWYRGNDQVATSLEYSFEATEDVTLEARFATRYTITFVPGSHSSSTIEPIQGSSVTAVNIDAVTADPSTLCVAQDWEFAGWSSEAVSETTLAPTTWVSGTEYYPTNDITLYAVYKKTEGAGSSTASIDFAAQGYTNAQAISDVAISNNVNVTFSQGTNNNAPKYYSSGSAIRCYGGNTFTVTATETSITNITLTFGTSGDGNSISVNIGTYNSNGTWTGNENSVTFTIGGTSGNRRIAGMSVTTFSGTVTYNSDPECFVYDVVVNPNIEHGTVTADPNTGVIAGTEITLTNTPSEGYHFAGWNVAAGNDPVTVENNKFLMPESDVNVSATFEPDTFTLTINYSIVGGGDAPQSYSDRLPFGTPYSVNTPVIAGLTPSQEVVSGTMPAHDETVEVTYSTVPYTLTIHYVYADNTPAANDVVRNLAYNVPYSETSPTIEGYTPDQAVVSGTMGEADLEVTVVYSINSHNLTVNYVNEASAQVAESHTATLNYHDNYSVTSPQVAGYAANKSVVSGTMGDADKTETVTYYQVQTNIVDATNCAGTGTGSLTVTAPTGNFEYSLDGVTFQTETQFANLNAGDYTLYIRPTGEDYNYSGVWTVNSNITMPVAEASVNPFYCLGDEINLSGNGSSTGSEYTYAWSGPNNFTATDINATIAAAEDIHSGSYTLTVTNTVTNCVSDTTVVVIVNTPNMNGYLFTIATHGDAYANLVGGQATPVFATPTVQHYLADAGCNVTLSNDAQATYEEAGDYTITWTATDACGNTATTTQVLHIVLGTCPVAADVDGNTYPVVALNNICWMAANLRTTHYSDGRLIPNPMVYTSVMYPDATANLDMFGYLYDWTAAMDAANGLVQDADGNVQGICPDGWRMPKENEIRALVNDGVSDIFDLRTTDQWLNNFGTNTTGFSLLPAGCYNANSDRFENLHGDAYIWGVGASAPAQPRVFWADCKCYNWQILDTTTPMGYSVRCVRNN